MQAVAPTHSTGTSAVTDAHAGAPLPAPAFADVYRDYFGFVWRSARALGARPAAIEDVVQEIFVVVHRLLPEFEGRSTLRTWLSKIVLNVVRHHLRSVVRKSPHERVRDEPVDPDALQASGPDPYERAVVSERTRLVQRVLDSLDREKRELLVLAEFEELTMPEISAAMGLKLNTAYSRLRLARRAFDEGLAHHRAEDSRRRS
jgi:RNA polymerase sigma-70 factor (ECF subfamily)